MKEYDVRRVGGIGGGREWIVYWSCLSDSDLQHIVKWRGKNREQLTGMRSLLGPGQEFYLFGIGVREWNLRVNRDSKSPTVEDVQYGVNRLGSMHGLNVYMVRVCLTWHSLLIFDGGNISRLIINRNSSEILCTSLMLHQLVGVPVVGPNWHYHRWQ